MPLSSSIYGIDLIDQAIVNDVMSKKIDSMRIGSFTFPNNPAKCSYSCDRTVIRHKYPELRATELEDLDPDAAIITGSGEFFGIYAYDQWNELNKIFQTHGVQEFYHPVFNDITQAIIKKLDASLEPIKNYISYTFEIWQHMPPVIISTTSINTTGILTSVSGSSQIVTLSRGDTGDWVLKLQKKLLADNPNSLPSYGADGSFGSETENAVRKYQAKFGLAIDGIAGSETLGHMGLSDYDGSAAKVTAQVSTYVVKQGDTLSKIASANSTTWQTLAQINSLKNPHSISPGQIIKLK